MGCCGSKKKSGTKTQIGYLDEEDWIGHNAHHNEEQRIWIPVQEPTVAVYHAEGDWIGHSTHHNEERQFFQHFFSVVDHLPDHQGILRRWEREAQQAEYNGSRYEMSHVWWDGAGYVKTLQRVKLFVSNKRFSSADHMSLTNWAKKVVKRRTAEYYTAKENGRADSKHRTVLEEWRGVKNTLQNLR